MNNEKELVFGHMDEGAKYRERPGAYALILNEKKQIAIVKTHNGFFLPGGGIENGENQEECLIRECSEEIGYDITVGIYLGKAANYAISFKGKEHLKIIGNFYKAKLIAPNNKKIEEDHELVWINPNEAVNIMKVEFQAWAIKNYLIDRLD